jgi:hypothetical protein
MKKVLWLGNQPSTAKGMNVDEPASDDPAEGYKHDEMDEEDDRGSQGSLVDGAFSYRLHSLIA